MTYLFFLNNITTFTLSKREREAYKLTSIKLKNCILTSNFTSFIIQFIGVASYYIKKHLIF